MGAVAARLLGRELEALAWRLDVEGLSGRTPVRWLRPAGTESPVRERLPLAADASPLAEPLPRLLTLPIGRFGFQTSLRLDPFLECPSDRPATEWPECGGFQPLGRWPTGFQCCGRGGCPPGGRIEPRWEA